MSLEENILDLKLNVQESLLDFITNPRIFQNLANNNINKDMLFDPLGYSKKNNFNPYYNDDGTLNADVVFNILDVIQKNIVDKNIGLLLFSMVDLIFLREKNSLFEISDKLLNKNEQVIIFNFKKEYVKQIYLYLNFDKNEENKTVKELLNIITKYKDLSIILNFYYENLINIIELTSIYSIFLLVYCFNRQYPFFKTEIFEYFQKLPWYNSATFSNFYNDLDDNFNNLFNSFNQPFLPILRKDIKNKIKIIQLITTYNKFTKEIEDNLNNLNPNGFNNEKFIDNVYEFFDNKATARDIENETTSNGDNFNTYKYISKTNNGNNYRNNIINFSNRYDPNNPYSYKEKFDETFFNNNSEYLREKEKEKLINEINKGLSLFIYDSNFPYYSNVNKKDYIHDDLNYVNNLIEKGNNLKIEPEIMNKLLQYKKDLIRFANQNFNYSSRTLNPRVYRKKIFNNATNNTNINSGSLSNRNYMNNTMVINKNFNNNNNLFNNSFNLTASNNRYAYMPTNSSFDNSLMESSFRQKLSNSNSTFNNNNNINNNNIMSNNTFSTNTNNLNNMNNTNNNNSKINFDNGMKSILVRILNLLQQAAGTIVKNLNRSNLNEFGKSIFWNLPLNIMKNFNNLKEKDFVDFIDFIYSVMINPNIKDNDEKDLNKLFKYLNENSEIILNENKLKEFARLIEEIDKNKVF